MLKRLISGLILILVLAVAVGCSSDKASTSDKVTYESHVKEIISNNCLTCHGTDAPTLDEFSADKDKYKAMMKGPRLDTYENLSILVNGEDAGAFMRRLDDGTNKEDKTPGNMNGYLGKTDEERAENLEILHQWVGNWSLKRYAELTPEELAAITALEK